MITDSEREILGLDPEQSFVGGKQKYQFEARQFSVLSRGAYTSGFRHSLRKFLQTLPNRCGSTMPML